MPTKLVSSAAKDDFCTTREAARLLGLSLGKVQQMTESGELKAWKTSGGHRRVSVQSVNENLSKRSAEISKSGSSREELSLLIAEDDQDLQKLYRMTISGWGMPISIQVVGSGFDGLIKIGVRAPDILILDLLMPGIDGFQMIARLRANPDLNQMDIIVVTGVGKDEIVRRGGLPASVTVFQKPVPFSELRGYLQARVSQRFRSLLT